LLFACIPLSVYGASDRPFEAAADLVTNSIKTPSYGWSAGSSYYLGDSIPVYTPEQGELVLHDDTAFFPVYQGSKIAGILTEINSGQRNVSYNFSKSFAEELDSVTQSGTKDFILVLNARQVFAYCDSTATGLVCYDIPLNTGENDINASFVVTAASRLPSISANKSCASNKKQLPISNAATRDPDTMFSVLNVDEWTQKRALTTAGPQRFGVSVNICIKAAVIYMMIQKHWQKILVLAGALAKIYRKLSPIFKANITLHTPDILGMVSCHCRPLNRRLMSSSL